MKFINDQVIFPKQDTRICKQHYTVNYQSEHQLLVEVYKDVETCILRGYMVAQMAFMIRGLRDRGKKNFIQNKFNFCFLNFLFPGFPTFRNVSE